MNTITFFNPKGRVGASRAIYHLAWMFADMGKRVLVADLDPQANVTSMFLPEAELEELWDPDDDEHQSIMAPLSPIIRGLGDIGDAPTKRIDENIHLVPGDLSLSNFESKLSESWGRCLDGDEPAFRTTSSFHRITRQAAEATEADLIMIDVGPNFGAINRAALISADAVVVPLAPDLFSIQGLRNLGPTLKAWRREWKKRLAEKPGSEITLPQGLMAPMGYVVIAFGIRDSRPVKAYAKWSERIPATYRDHVLGEHGESQFSYDDDEHCLGQLKHYRSLMPMAMEARKPIFQLTAADGAIGAHNYSVRNCYDDFHQLAGNILDRLRSDMAIP